MESNFVPIQVEGHPDCPYAVPAQSPPIFIRSEKEQVSSIGIKLTERKIDDDIIFLEILAHRITCVVREVSHWNSLQI